MKFYTATKKAPNVPIISLLDILAILLIYTVVAFQSKKTADEEGKGDKGELEARKQASLIVDIPSTTSLTPKNVSEVRSQIILTGDGKIEFDGTEIDNDVLDAYLRGFKERNPLGKLEIKADKSVTLEQWVYMLESLKKAGISAKEVPWLIKDKRNSL